MSEPRPLSALDRDVIQNLAYYEEPALVIGRYEATVRAVEERLRGALYRMDEIEADRDRLAARVERLEGAQREADSLMLAYPHGAWNVIKRALADDGGPDA